MNKLDFIYYKLCKKYGFERIAYKKEIKSFIDMKPNPENKDEFIYNEDLGESFGGIYFINIYTKEKIDLRKEQMEGTFNE